MLNLQNLKFLQRLFDSFMHIQKISYPDLKYYFRWITKSEHGVSNIADEVKARIRRIANSPTTDLASQAITDLQEWNRYSDKLKSWFECILAFDHFFFLQNGFQSQFYALICVLVPIIRGQGVVRELSIIFPSPSFLTKSISHARFLPCLSSTISVIRMQCHLPIKSQENRAFLFNHPRKE